MEATIEKLEQVRQLMERDRAEAARQLREAEENRRKSERLKAELSVRLEKARELLPDPEIGQQQEQQQHQRGNPLRIIFALAGDPVFQEELPVCLLALGDTR